MKHEQKILRIKKIVEETHSIKTFFVEGELNMEPGQFFMVWIPGVDEKPLTLSYVGKNPAITVRRHGDGTKALHKLKVGDLIGFKGPFGRGFDLKLGKKPAIVAGGIGMIALSSLASEIGGADLFCGAKTKEEMVFAKRFKMECCSDDGSVGKKCFSPELFEVALKEEKYDCVYTCGPEVMMVKMHELCTKYKIRMQASLERYMKCGVGICGSCVCSDRLVCKDGPVFYGEELSLMKDFGKSALLMSGKEVELGEYFRWIQNK